MVQQLISDGNIRSRLRKASPIGLIARTRCRFRRILSMNLLYMLSGVISIWAFSLCVIICIYNSSGAVFKSIYFTA